MQIYSPRRLMDTARDVATIGKLAALSKTTEDTRKLKNSKIYQISKITLICQFLLLNKLTA